MRKLYKYWLVIIMMFVLMSFNYQPQIREPFEEYKVEQPNAAPSRAPIDWNGLDYNDPYWGWYYRQLWYIYHPNGSETPPWIQTVPINDEYILLIFAGIYLLIIMKPYIIISRDKIKVPDYLFKR